MFSTKIRLFFRRYRTDANAILYLILLLVLIYLPLLYHQVANSADYRFRIEEAYSLLEIGGVAKPSPNLLYSGLIMLATIVLPLDASNAAVVVTLVCYLATGIIVYVMLRRSLEGWIPRRLLMLLIFLTFTLLTIAPITTALFVSLRRMLFGYVAISPHHNPTIQLLRPFSLITLVMAVPVFRRAENAAPWRYVLGAIVMILLSLFAKQNWGIAFLPALALMALWYMIRRQPVDWRLLLAGYAVPSAVVLALQYMVIFSGQDSSGSQVVFAPLRAILAGGSPLWSLPVTLLLSILFPVYVGWRYFAVLRYDTGWWLAALSFFMALVQGLLLDESGERQGHGNFLWGLSITAFVWFVVSMQVFLRQNQAVFKQEISPDRAFWAGAVLYLLHALVGIFWLIAHYLPTPIVLG